ncbi:unnamed protein product [Dovyalis caffra]|uniref:Uncharacterized protein n=1 Tax=Dovyalis caffra TaxID=77055 RepID=A0AAV1RVH1_9ROSI|nr:unnamed protein product [Dovyalis caffra]
MKGQLSSSEVTIDHHLKRSIKLRRRIGLGKEKDVAKIHLSDEQVQSFISNFLGDLFNMSGASRND